MSMQKIRHNRESGCVLGVSRLRFQLAASACSPPPSATLSTRWLHKIECRAASLPWMCLHLCTMLPVPGCVSIWVLKSGLQWRRFSLLFASIPNTPPTPPENATRPFGILLLWSSTMCVCGETRISACHLCADNFVVRCLLFSVCMPENVRNACVLFIHPNPFANGPPPTHLPPPQL